MHVKTTTQICEYFFSQLQLTLFPDGFSLTFAFFYAERTFGKRHAKHIKYVHNAEEENQR